MTRMNTVKDAVSIWQLVHL